MHVQLDIQFDQLVQLVKTLPEEQQELLKAEMDKHVGIAKRKKSKLEKLLLAGPIATKRQLNTIAQNRKEINKWRTK